MPDPLSSYASAPFNGPFKQTAYLLDGVAYSSYEGLWIPMAFAKSASAELSGSFTSASLTLLGTNLENPPNQQVVTVAGSITAGDVATLSFMNPNSGATAVAYTVQAGDTPTTIATALAAAINASTTLAKAGVKAATAAGAITISYPSVYNQLGSFPTSSSPGVQNQLTIIPSLNNGATETLTLSTGTNGTSLATMSAVGFVQLLCPINYIKARVTALAGTNATLTLALLGVG